ncbi:UNVERIFIED_ORG: hypothetical protein GGR68_003552 [Xanthomonas campestris]|nr:hypothetical protein XarbCFBP8153_18955 [Xanthomonas arboricola]
MNAKKQSHGCGTKSGQHKKADGRQVGTEGALRIEMYEWSVPLPSAGRTRMAAAQSVCWPL